VANDSNFYTIASRALFATYHVLWYRLPGFHHFSKIEVLLPEIMTSLQWLPRVAYRRSRSGMPLMSLLLLKLQAWMDHRAPDKFYPWQNQHIDTRDIGELLELAVEKYVNVRESGCWSHS
jgi:hypothetical protein